MTEEKNLISSERRCNDLQSMDIVVGNFARKILGKKAFIEADIIHNWTEIVGEEWATYTKPLQVIFKKDQRKEGVLHIEVASGALALELELKSKQIISRVNTYFGYDAVNRIKIIQNLQLATNMQTSTDNLEKTLVSETQENYIKHELQGISDPDLADTLESLGRAILSNNNNQK